jgi:aspartate aminotransferase
MRKRVSNRLAQVELSATYAILDLVQDLRGRGMNVLDLGGGEPDFPTPAHIGAAGITAIDAGDTHYTASRGRPALLTAIAEKLARDNGIYVEPGTGIIATPSAKHALFITLMTLLDSGDEIIIPTPSWVSYKSMAQLAGANPIELPLSSENNFTLTRECLETRLTPRTRAILLNTPNNPTGRMLKPDEAEAIADFAERHDLIIVADEIYEKIVYGDARHISIASLPQAANRTLTINGFSKAYAMTGWRLGYVAGPADLIEQILKVQQHTVGCAGSFVQSGGEAALKGNQQPISDMVDIYATRRRLIVDGLNAIPGIRCTEPDGAFYAFPNIRQTGLGNSTEFTTWLLQNAGVAVTPGSAFGPGGEGHIRLSFATTAEVITDAVERIRQAVLSACTPDARAVSAT